MKSKEESPLDRQVVYESIRAIRNGRNPKVRHMLPRKWEVAELSGLTDKEIRRAVAFLETWGVIVRTRGGWIYIPLPEDFCWKHGLNSKIFSEAVCPVCANRNLKQRGDIIKMRTIKERRKRHDRECDDITC